MADKASERMVIVERRHNRIVLWRTGGAIAAVLLTMVALGWVARAEALDAVGKFDAAANTATRVLDESVAANDRATQALALKRLAEVADAPCCGPSPAQLAAPACGCGAKA